MRRLIILPLLLAGAFALGGQASAQPGDECYPATFLDSETVTLCYGVRCNDICAPEPYAYVTCSSGTLQARCSQIGVK